MNEKNSAAEFRTEKDSMGEMRVPNSAYYAAQTQRAVENFPISDLRFPRSFIRALGIIKGAAAEANHALGLLDDRRYELIRAATREVEAGDLDSHFVLDIFQTGSGTSTNMNANEVIANRAKELGRHEIAIHRNDHVNMSQSSNDIIPTAIHVSAAFEISKELLPALRVLEQSLERKAEEFADLVKTGRTHLMDATPITLGQEFSGYQSQLHMATVVRGQRFARCWSFRLVEPLWARLNTHPEFAARTIALISKHTGLEFFEAKNHFEAQAAKDAVVEASGQLKAIACSMAKIANDLRWLGSGPRCGLGELLLPEVQPGSSIMPAKVNPVIAESVLMVSAQVIGNDAAITVGGYSGGILELNVMMPVMAYGLLQSVTLLSNSARNFAAKCVDGIRPNINRIEYLAEASIAICTALAPKIGYDQAAKLAKEAYASGESLRQVAVRHQALPLEELDRILDLRAMTKPGL